MKGFSYLATAFLVLLLGLWSVGWRFFILLAVFVFFLAVSVIYRRQWDKYSYWPYIKAPDGELYTKSEYCRKRINMCIDWEDYFPELTKKIIEEDERKKKEYRRKRIEEIRRSAV